MTRLEQLQQFYDQDPADPFNLYALGLEYQKSDVDQAAACFESIIKTRPDYLAVYYTLGKLYIEMNKPGQATPVFEAGIEQARRQQATKVMRELKSALDELLFD